MDVAFLNSKGFGGNNATATVLSPRQVESMLQQRYGADAFVRYATKRESVRATAKAYDDAALQGDLRIIYNFGSGIIEEHEISVSDTALSLDRFANPVSLQFANPYADMVND